MPSRNELNARARSAGFDPATIPNDSKLEQKVLYLEKNSAAKTGTAAISTLTSTNTEVTDAETVTIGSVTYRFKDTMTQAYDVKRDGTTADTTLGNLVKAINGTGVPGTEYFAGTNPHPLVTAGAVTAHATAVTARDTNVGSDLATTETSGVLSWTSTTLNAGTAGVAGVVAVPAAKAAGAWATNEGISGDRNTSL